MSQLILHYHRDFDGMVSAAILARILRGQGEQDIRYRHINYDQKRNWDAFGEGERFAIVDFHFHPRCEYWFDHHPTTFLSEELRAAYQPSERWAWDEASPSCPPLILRHAAEYWGYQAPERFVEMAYWSDIIDAATFKDVDQAIFGDDPALRIMRSLTVAPNPNWTDELTGALSGGTLDKVAARADVEKAYARAARNRDRALEQFPSTVLWKRGSVLFFDAASSKVRRERFAPFYHHPELSYAVGVIPTRAGFHITCGENPWNQPKNGVHVGELLGKYGGGGHRAVGGANPPSQAAALAQGEEVAEFLVAHMAANAS
ncbi:MAG TPA: hypothetical protein PLJ12_14150 [Planctomycetota bacterium]|nr:hypothetical protein [Planctomycetota bacterium]